LYDNLTVIVSLSYYGSSRKETRNFIKFTNKMAFAANAVLGLGLSFLLATITSANHTSYNSLKQICCNGTVYDQSDSNSLSCCGDISYDYTTSICCLNNKVLDNPDNTTTAFSYGCCFDPVSGNTVAYQYATQRCCNGKVVEQPNDCCGDKGGYDTTKQICCTKYTFDGASQGTTEYSINDIADNKTICCGLENYDYRKSVCCNDDVVTPKKEGMDEDSFGGCCGKEPYDSSKQVCCSNWNGTSMMDTVLYNINGTANSCCGSQLFDYTSEVCCDGNKKLPKPQEAEANAWLPCCGDEVITFPPRQICIDGKIHPRRGPTHEVCGREQYDYRRQFCCNDKIYGSFGDQQCCYSTTVPEVYNTRKQLCCSDGVQPLTIEDRRKGNNACCSPFYFIPIGTLD